MAKVIAVAAAILVASFGLALLAVHGENKPPPKLCQYVDVNPSKGADYRLICGGR